MHRCNLCGSTTWTVLEQHGPTSVVACRCGLVFVTPVPPRPEIEAVYGEDYYDAWQAQGPARRKMWERRLASVQRLIDHPGRLLDVGCGDATFLRLAKGAGWTVAGTELSPEAVWRAGDLSVRQGEIWEAQFPSQSFDVVTGWHVIEHASDPTRMVREMFRLLKPGGWLMLATPNLKDYIFRLGYFVGRLRWPALYEEDERELHLFHFSDATLSRLIAAAGFSDIRTGFDAGAATVPAKQLINALAHSWYRVTGLNWGIGLQVIARKPEVDDHTRPWQRMKTAA